MPATKKKSSKSKQKSTAAKYTKPRDEVPSFYANNTNLSVSAYDFKITFGQVIEADDKGMLVDPKAIIFLSPQHAKAVSNLLVDQIKAYEKRTGQTVSDPPPTK